MFSILIAIFIFLVTFFAQLIIVRILGRLHVHEFASFIVYPLGLFFLSFQILPSGELAYTAILVYVLLALLLINLSFVPLLGKPSPSSVIMTRLKKGPTTHKQLVALFDEESMINDRLEDLVKVKLVNKQNNHYIISPVGIYMARSIVLVGRLIGQRL